jgi:H+/Cl- antiporter ClcA
MDGKLYLRLIGLGALIGIPAAFCAAAFLALVHESQHWLWHDLPDALGTSSPGWYLVIGLPAVGACVVILARRLLPGDGGHAPLVGLSGGPTLLRYGPGVGGVLMLEGGLGMGAALIGVLLPGFVAAAIGYVIFLGLGSWGGLDSQAIAVPGLPVYNHEHVYDLVTAIVVGILAALLIFAVRRAATRVARDGLPRLGMGKLLIAGGLLTGVVAEVADLLGANSQDVLFSGQSSIPALVSQTSTKILLVLLLAKAIGYCICLGCGFRGGPVFPAIFLGVAVGMLAVLWLNVSPTLAVAAGSAAGMTAMTRLLLTSILFSTLLVGHAGIDAAPATVLAAVAAWLTMQMLDRRASVQAVVSAHQAQEA